MSLKNSAVFFRHSRLGQAHRFTSCYFLNRQKRIKPHLCVLSLPSPFSSCCWWPNFSAIRTATRPLQSASPWPVVETAPENQTIRPLLMSVDPSMYYHNQVFCRAGRTVRGHYYYCPPKLLYIPPVLFCRHIMCYKIDGMGVGAMNKSTIETIYSNLIILQIWQSSLIGLIFVEKSVLCKEMSSIIYYLCFLVLGTV